MIRYGATIRTVGALPKVAAKVLKPILSKSYRILGEHFKTHNLKHRFTYHGFKLLNMTPRKGPYNARKLKEKGHRDPNVWSGDSRRAALSPRIDTKGSVRTMRAELVMKARNLNFKNPNSNVHPADEVRRISQREHPTLVRVLGNSIEENLKSINVITKVKVAA